VPVPHRATVTTSAVVVAMGAGTFTLGWWLGRRHLREVLGAVSDVVIPRR
jgi:hypothetical protein